ncbi:uncharacterized protein LOC134267076 isoform X2 [Saccostrea cucullata]|uniref:uncharacterized protein LOC134267076 isoform X2 n=1 Tax=Saccostrea cuccullata TaxID=36930 RepID=UPI002ED68808
MMETDQNENLENWRNFLQPLQSKRKAKNCHGIKIFDINFGNDCLSQEFAIKLMKDKPYSITFEPPKAQENAPTQQNNASFHESDTQPSFSEIDASNENSRDNPIVINDEEPCTSYSQIRHGSPKTPNTFDKQNGMFTNSLKTKQRRNKGKLIPWIKNKHIQGKSKFSIHIDTLHVGDKYSVQRRRARNALTKSARIANKKDDFDLPCSQWNIVLLSRYFCFKDCVEKLELRENIDNREGDLDRIIEDFMYRMTIASSNFKQNVEKTEETLNFISLCNTEIGARLVLNEIMFPVCAYLGLSIEIEKTVDCVFLPKSRFDYRIINSDGDAVGAVEAKSAGSLCQESIVQAITQLCVLQTEHLVKKDTDQVVNTPLFNILTDGIRYVFIVLRGKKLQFEQVDGRVSVREVRSWHDVKILYRSLVTLMREQTLPPEVIDLSTNENDVELIEMALI